jgi:hypothetical protein
MHKLLESVRTEYQLLVRPRPFHDESSLGYLNRVANSNALDIRQLLNLVASHTTCHQWEYFHQYLCLESPDSARLIGPFPHGWQVTSSLKGIATIEFNHVHRRWCPLCLQDNGYLRGVWGVKQSCVCEVHGCFLQEDCTQCHQKQTWQFLNLLKCAQCGAALDKMPIQPASRIMAAMQYAFVANFTGVKSEFFPELDTNAWLRLIRYLGQFNGVELPKRPGQISGFHHLEVAKACMSNVANLLDDWPYNFERLLQCVQSSQPAISSLKKTFGVLYRVLYFHLRDNQFQFLRDAFETYLHQHWWGMVCKRNRAFKPTTIAAHPRLTLKQAAKQTGLAPSLIRHLSTNKVIVKNNIRLPSGRQVSSFHQANLPHIEAIAKDVMDLQTTATYLGVSERVVRELIATKIVRPIVMRKQANMANWLISKQQVKHLLIKTIFKQNEDLVSFSSIVKHWRLRDGELVQLVKALISKELNAFDDSHESVVIGKAMLDKLAAKNWLCTLRKGLNTLSIDEAAQQLGIKQQVAYHLEKVGLLLSIQTKQAGKQIPKDAIITFDHKYIALSILAKLQQTSPTALFKTLKVKPITGPKIDGGRQYFYLRSTLQMTKGKS